MLIRTNLRLNQPLLVQPIFKIDLLKTVKQTEGYTLKTGLTKIYLHRGNLKPIISIRYVVNKSSCSCLQSDITPVLLHGFKHDNKLSTPLTHNKTEGISKGSLSPSQTIIWEVHVLSCAVDVSSSNPGR